MKHLPHPRHPTNGSALITVIFLIVMMGLLTSSMLHYSGNERRGNERNRLILRAKNMAESISLYAAEQMTTKLYRMGSVPTMHFEWTGTGANRLYLPPDGVLNTGFINATTAEVRAGIESATPLVLVTDTSSPNFGLQISTARVPIIAKSTATHAALGSVTAYVEQDMEIALTPLFQFGMFYNMDLELYPSPNFTLAGPVHTNNRLMAHPEWSSTNSITFLGRVSAAEGVFADHSIIISSRFANGTSPSKTHTSGNVYFKHKDTGAPTSLKTTASPILWRDHKYLRNPPGSAAAPTVTELSNFKAFATATYGSNLRTNVHGVTKLKLPGIGTYKTTDDPDTPEDDRNNGRQIIEPPHPKKWIAGAWSETEDAPALLTTKISWRAGLYIIVNPDNENRYGRLPLPYQPNPSLANPHVVDMLPNSYRCWLNIIDTNTGVHTLKEVVLPGQPSYGYHPGIDGIPATGDEYMYKNNLPNRYTTATSQGSNQVLRMAQIAADKVKYWNTTLVTPDWEDAATTPFPGTLPNGVGYSAVNGLSAFPADNITTGTAAAHYPADAYFFDMRRANGNWGFPFNRSNTNVYKPRPIAKIDFDMARFKMAVRRTMYADTALTLYNLKAPGGGATAAEWDASIFKASGVPASHGLGMVGPTFSTFPTAGTSGEMMRQDPYQIYYVPEAVGEDTPVPATQLKIGGDNTLSDPRVYKVTTADLNLAWYDGIAIYVHSVDAEVRAQSTPPFANRIDSGVRLWNGRGPAASLTAAGVTGLTFVTNDSVYIIGHFNADGTCNSDSGDATAYGGFSGQFPDNNSEYLCAVMGDSVHIVSQPVFSGNTLNAQTSGWSDALSVLPHTTGIVANWSTTDPSTTNNTTDGQRVNSSYELYPATLPNLSAGPTPNSSGRATKLPALNTEVSTALVVGLVPSDTNPTGLSDRTPRDAANGTNTGGANNFPRMMEAWNSTSPSQTLYIRGSMVALFESRVAMEPFTNSRDYAAPTRAWGLHQSFSTVHDLPLEPIVLGATRVGFRDLSESEYATMKALIEGL